MPVSIPANIPLPEVPIGAGQGVSSIPQAPKEGREPTKDFGVLLSEQDSGPASTTKSKMASPLGTQGTKPFERLVPAIAGGGLTGEDVDSNSSLTVSPKAAARSPAKAQKTTAASSPKVSGQSPQAGEPVVLCSQVIPLPENAVPVTRQMSGSAGPKSDPSVGASDIAASSIRDMVSHSAKKPEAPPPQTPQDVAVMPVEADPKSAAHAAIPVPIEETASKADKTIGENIAAEERPSENGGEMDPSSGFKNALAISKEQVATPSKPVGTSVANLPATMNNEAFNQSAAVAPADGVSAASDRLPGREPGVDMSQASSANAAVESALQVGDLQAAATQGTQSSVNLRFNVGGEDLAVRVALQAGQLHTQFNTASGDLRSVLAHEWHPAVPATNGGGRFAEPVFTGGSRDLSDPGHEGRRQPNPNQTDADEPTGTRGPGTASAVVQGPSQPDDGALTPVLAGHLQSFA